MKVFALLALLLIQVPEQLRLQTGVVRGVIRGTDGRPAAGVRVSAIPDRPADGAAVPDMLAVLTQTDASGRYTLEGIPPGRYRIAAGLIDALSYYPGVSALQSAQAVMVSAGTTVSDIDFTLAQSPGVRVAGRIIGFPAGSAGGLLRVALIGGRPTNASVSQPVSRPQDAIVGSDGTFEFLKVAPGSYDVRLSPSLQMTSLTRIHVENMDFDSLSLSPGNGILLAGTAAVGDGTPIPTRKAFAGKIDAPAMVQLGTTQMVVNSLGSGIVTPVRASDGAFLLMLQEGEYRIGAVQLPLGYSIRSITLGSTDLLAAPLKVTSERAGRSEPIRVTLTTTPPQSSPAWRKVSGRVFGFSALQTPQAFVAIENSSTPAYSLAATGGTIRRLGEVFIREDGTFEIANVPPGAYTLRVLNPLGRGFPDATIGLTVAESDVTGVELLSPESPMPAGVPVSGHVTLATVNESSLMPHTVVLFGNGGRSFHSPVSPTGTFEFPNVTPGEYDLRTLPLTLPSESARVLVQVQEVTGLRVALPPQSNILGRLRMEDGKSLPDLGSAQLKLVSPQQEINIPIGADGAFAVRIVHGEYRISVVNMPPGYALTSSALSINAPATANIAIGLRGVTP